MRKLRELTTYASLQELAKAWTSEIVDGATSPEVRPEGEKKFVKLHKTEKHADPYGNKKPSDATKKDTSRAGREPLPGFPPEVKEEEDIDEGKKEPSWPKFNREWAKTQKTKRTAKDKAKDASARRRAEMSKKHPELAEEIDEASWGIDELGRFRRIDEAAGIARGMAKSANPLIKRPKYDARGNVVLTKDAKKNIEYGKGPRSRKLTGRPYSTQKRFGEEKEQLDERGIADVWNDDRRLKDRAKKKETVLVSPKGEKGGGKVSRIPKSQYDPKKHSLAEDKGVFPAKVGNADYVAGRKAGRLGTGDYDKEKYKSSREYKRGYEHGSRKSQAVAGARSKMDEEQIDEKNWIQNAIKKPGALTASAHRAKKSVGEFAQEHKHSGGKVGQRSRLALTLGKLRKEEAEQIDELKKETLGNYLGHAIPDKKNAEEGLKTRRKYGMGPGALKRVAKNRDVGIDRAAQRIRGVFDVGKPMKVMIPGKGDNDPASGPYTMKRKKLYHAEEAEQLDELSKKTVGNYARAATSQLRGHAGMEAHAGARADEFGRGRKSKAVWSAQEKYYSRKAGNREQGLQRAVSRLAKEEAEQIDELSRRTLKSYIGKADQDMWDTQNRLDKYRGKHGLGSARASAENRLAKREKNYYRATDKVFGTNTSWPPVKIRKEETQLDELSKGTLGNYVKKAGYSASMSSFRSGKLYGKELATKRKPAKDRVEANAENKNTLKREKGISLAVKKLTKEETQLDEVITKSTPAGDVIHDFVHSKNKVFSGDSKKQRIKRALGAYYGKQRGE